MNYKTAAFSTYLILDTNFSPKCVFCGPLLRERQTIFSPFVLGFQGASDLTGVYVGRARRFKFLKWTEEINTTIHQIELRNDFHDIYLS